MEWERVGAYDEKGISTLGEIPPRWLGNNRVMFRDKKSASSGDLREMMCQ